MMSQRVAAVTAANKGITGDKQLCLQTKNSRRKKEKKKGINLSLQPDCSCDTFICLIVSFGVDQSLEALVLHGLQMANLKVPCLKGN